MLNPIARFCDIKLRYLGPQLNGEVPGCAGVAAVDNLPYIQFGANHCAQL